VYFYPHWCECSGFPRIHAVLDGVAIASSQLVTSRRAFIRAAIAGSAAVASANYLFRATSTGQPAAAVNGRQRRLDVMRQ
jgi:hypothetical protein